MRKSQWRGKDVKEFQKTNIAFPKRIWEGAKIQAMREGRTLQELVAESVDEYLKRARKGGRDAG